MPKCARCTKRTFDGTPWNSDTVHSEFNGKYLCASCKREISSNQDSPKNFISTKKLDIGNYALLALLLLISAVLLLGPLGTALLNASEAMSGYYISSEAQDAFNNAILQFSGFVVLFVFLGFALYRMYKVEKTSKL